MRTSRSWANVTAVKSGATCAETARTRLHSRLPQCLEVATVVVVEVAVEADEEPGPVDVALLLKSLVPWHL